MFNTKEMTRIIHVLENFQGEKDAIDKEIVDKLKKTIGPKLCSYFDFHPQDSYAKCPKQDCTNCEYSVKKHGVVVKPKSQNKRVGCRNHLAKLTEDDVKLIYDLGACGTFSQRKLGEMFNVHHSTIEAILNGSTWNHVTGLEPKIKR